MNKAALLVTAILTLGSMVSVVAKADYVVSAIHGKVVTGGQQLKLAQKLAPGAEVSSTDADAKVKLTDGGQTLLMRGEFRVKLSTSQEPLTVFEGRLRAKVAKAAAGAPAFQMRTPEAVAGVRGTDFFLSYGATLHESEIVCFESAVDFSSDDKKSHQIVNAGQWGGIGGRFGKAIAKPLDLPAKLIADFASATEVGD